MKAEHGNTVKIHYTGKLDDGTVFDSSVDRRPLEFTIGAGEVIPGFEEGVIGMSLGEFKTIRIPPDKAYGPRRDELFVVIDRSKLPSDPEPEVGKKVDIHQENGPILPAVITNVSESEVRLDINHPLAGKDLHFDIELVAII